MVTLADNFVVDGIVDSVCEGGFSTRIIERGNGERSGAGCTVVLRLNSEKELLRELFFPVKRRSRSRPRLRKIKNQLLG